MMANETDLSGLDNDYYMIVIKQPRRGGPAVAVEVEDIIEALEMPFAEATIFKSLVRLQQLRLGKGKAGSTEKYEAEKVNYYGVRVLEKVRNGLVKLKVLSNG